MLREELDQLQQKLREVRQLELYAQEGKVLMGGGIFICYGQEMIYLAGGTYGRFLHFHPAYAMQWHMIRAAKHAGMRAYNFYGTADRLRKIRMVMAYLPSSAVSMRMSSNCWETF